MCAAIPRLNRQQLTGRSDSHVARQDELACRLHPVAARALCAMRAAAAEEGLDLSPASAFRDFERQLRIWNDKCRGLRPLLDRDGRPVDSKALRGDDLVDTVLIWSALPGASRHHWGTDFDLVDASVQLAPGEDALSPENYAAGGAFGPLAAWLGQHAEFYGFYLPYDLDRGGVQPEPWHWSYAPIAASAQADLTIETLADALSEARIEGKEHIEARLPALYERYVLRVADPSDLVLNTR